MGLLILEAAFTEFRNTAPTCLLSNSEGCQLQVGPRGRESVLAISGHSNHMLTKNQ